jgi:hypothetical protein
MQKENILIKPSLKTLVHNLGEKGFHIVILRKEKEVKDYINTQIPDRINIGLGNSITSCRLNIRYILAAKGCQIFYSWDGSENYNRSIDTFENLPRPEYYLTRITAMSAYGEILVKDYNKRAADMHQFPAHVFAFAGLNHVIEELEYEEDPLKYPVIKKSPENIQFTVVILPFLEY